MSGSFSLLLSILRGVVDGESAIPPEGESGGEDRNVDFHSYRIVLFFVWLSAPVPESGLRVGRRLKIVVQLGDGSDNRVEGVHGDSILLSIISIELY